MKPKYIVRPTKWRSPVTGLLRAACVFLLPAFSWTQGLLPCPAETQTWAVANTNDTATLARLLNCANGSFNVEWLGNVFVSQTLFVTEGTKLNITGATSGATADGNHKTQLFAVDGRSSLHLADITLANGDAEFGGAILALEQSSVSFGGNMTLIANSASYGGAIYAGSSTTVSWGGEETTFIDNVALNYGGAILAEGGSAISWRCETVFINNSALYRGGAVYLSDFSNVSWSSNTIFVDNTAWRGGAIYVAASTAVWSGEATAFTGNYALFYGGALMAEESSSVSCDGVTVFINNSAEYLGGAVFANESSNICWSSQMLFTTNTALVGGAIYADSSSRIDWDGEDTKFSSNRASYFGGALAAEGSSSISWDSNTVLADNLANISGGAAYISDNSNVSWAGATVFTNNEVQVWGGGLYVTDHSKVSWTGTTTFLNNYAQDGGGLFMFNSIVDWSGTTSFENNRVSYTGGGLAVHSGSEASWTDITTFTSNVADRAGAIFVWASDISWTGNTTFANNVAHGDGGAVYATVGSNMHCQGVTTFRNNTSTAGNGGALGVYEFGSADGSYANISGKATFTDNVALLNGGAVFSSANRRGQNYEEVVFRSNSAAIGGAVATFGTGNNDEVIATPTTFSRCHFINNTATETGGAVETAFGQDILTSCRFENNSADIGGALRLGGGTTIRDCSFVSNMAANIGLAVAAVGSAEIYDSEFRGNVFSCREGEFLHTDKKIIGTARYDSVCGGCPSWEDCQNCTVDDISSAPICLDALARTTANESGTTVETLSVDEGYWRVTRSSTTILACYNPDACGGGQTGSETFCSDGYSGAYCSVCESGYSSSLSSTCTRCSPSRRQWLVAITVAVGIIAACATAVFSENLVSTKFEERNTASIHHMIVRRIPLQAFKIVLIVWQILTQFASVANVTYPGVYQTFLSGLDIINLDVGFVMSAGCLWSDIDFHDRLLAGTIWPLVLLGLLGITYAVALRRNSAAGNSVRGEIRHKHLSAVLFLMFFVYSSVSSTVFRMFACDSLDDGEEYLRADYRIRCTDEKHRVLQLYAGFMIAIYPVGIPLLFGVLLYRHREVLSDPGADKAAAQSISSLWAPYRHNRFYYEIIECGRRIVLTGAVVFIYPNDTAQIAITIMNTFFFFVVSEVLSPYESALNTWISRFGHVLIFFSMFDVLLLRVDVSQESSESQKVLAGVLVVGHVVMILAVVAEACALFLAAKRERLVVEAPTPIQRALPTSTIAFGQERAESDCEFQGSNGPVS